MSPEDSEATVRVFGLSKTGRPNGWALLGELGKWVAVSPQRFLGLAEHAEDGLQAARPVEAEYPDGEAMMRKVFDELSIPVLEQRTAAGPQFVEGGCALLSTIAASYWTLHGLRNWAWALPRRWCYLTNRVTRSCV